MKRFRIVALASAMGGMLLCSAAELAPVSPGALDWDVRNVVNWRWIGDAVCNTSGGDYIYSLTTPAAPDFIAGVTVTPREKLSSVRAEAALALTSPDRRDAWRLALAEDGGKRFADLTLVSPNGNIAKTGENFHWEYGTPYRLRLHSVPGKAVGEVLAKDGTVLCRIAADLPESVKPFPASLALYTTALRSEFRAPAAAWSDPVPALPAPKPALNRPEYRAPRNVSHEFSDKATGYFHTAQTPAGRWYLVDPLGHGFFACGVDGLQFGGRFCEALGYAPYGRNVQKKFGSREKWAEHAAKRLDEWGFNYAGTCAREFRNRLPFSENLMIGSSFAAFGNEYDICPYLGRVGSALPNPFHPRFGEWCKRRYTTLVGSEVENPYFLGYFCDNELRWLGKSRNPDGSGVFDSVMEKQAGHSARIALTDFLRKRSGDNIERFNLLWNSKLNSFDELPTLTALPHRTPEQLEAKLDFLTLTAETYFRTIRDSLREADPNHMLLGCRFAGVGSAHARVWQAAGKYCDIVSFNQYPIADFDRNELWIGGGGSVREEFDRIHRLTGRPLMITEWAFLGLDSGLPCEYGAGQRLPTQAERTRAAELFLRTLLAMPYMVGHNWYEHSDDPKLGIRKAHPENSNYGLVNEEDEPYAELTAMFTRIHSDIDAARKKGPEPRPLQEYGELYAGFSSPRLPQSASSPLKLTLGDGRFEASNGRFTLRYSGSGGRIEVLLDGKPYGAYLPLVRCLGPGGTEWEGAQRLEIISGERRAAGIVLAFTAAGSCTAGEFAVDCRILLPEKGEYAIADVTAVRNTGSVPLELRGIYFQEFPAFVPSAGNRRPNAGVNFYKKSAAWRSESGMFFGGAASLTRIHFNFYRDEAGALHPDGYHPVERTIAPGDAWTPPYPCYVFVFAGNGDPDAAAQELINRDLK